MAGVADPEEIGATGGAVHVVSSGAYSDYTVLCALPDKETADSLVAAYDELCARHGVGSDARVEAIGLYNGPLECVARWHRRICLDWEGKVLVENDYTTVHFPWEHDRVKTPVSWLWCVERNGQYGDLYVDGTDFERVRRVLSDKQRQIVAQPDVWKERKLAHSADRARSVG